MYKWALGETSHRPYLIAPDNGAIRFNEFRIEIFTNIKYIHVIARKNVNCIDFFINPEVISSLKNGEGICSYVLDNIREALADLVMDIEFCNLLEEEKQ